MNHILFNIIICAGVMLPAGASALTVSNPAPGSLAEAVGADTTATTLTVSGGAVNAADFAFLADKMHKLESLDLSATAIAPYAGSAIRMTGVKKSDADVLPPYALIGMKFLRTVRLPQSLTAIGQGAFTGSAIVTAEVPAKVTTIGDNAFRRCESLTEVSLPASLTSLGSGAFANCTALEKVTFASGTPLTRLPESAFEGCVALNKINLQALTACTEIGPWAVAHCRSLTAIELPEGTRTVANGAMMATTSVETAKLPNTLLYIGDNGMAAMSALESIDARTLKDVPELGNDVWRGVNQSDVTLEVGTHMTDEFADDPQWGKFNIHENHDTTQSVTPAISAGTRFHVYVTDGSITIVASNDARLGNVAVYDTAGHRVAFIALAGADITADTRSWAHGVYLISCDLGVAKITI